MPLRAFDVDTKLGGGIFDYDWGNGYEIYRDIERANSTLLKVNNPSTTTTPSTAQVTLKRGKPITSKSSQKQAPTPSLTIQDYVNTADWTPKWKSQGYRPSPTRSASAEKNLSLGVGNDGQIYMINKDKNGVQRWTKSKTLTVENISVSALNDKNDLLRAVAILQSILDEPSNNLDNDEVQGVKDKQADFIMEYNKR